MPDLVEIEKPGEELELSDEDFEKLAPPSFEESEESETNGEEELESEEDTDDPTETNDSDKEEEQETETNEDEESESEDSLDTGKVENDAEEINESESDDEEDEKTTDKNQDDTESDIESTIDYEAEYKKLTAPFKANGADMQVKNSDDAITLMKMGANYHKKMAGLKPSLKILKLLEQNNLTDPEQLNFLIDLNNKDPKAITKLLKDSKIDPLDINVTADSDYQPTTRSVTDTELDLDSVLEDIRDTPSYAKTLNVITKEWDDTSRQTVASAPHIISVINGHIADGTYDQVMGTVNYERSLGKLQGVSDFEAYKQMGDVLAAAGQLSQQPANTQPKMGKRPSKETPDKNEAARKKRKKAAGSSKSKKSPAVKTYDPLALSDEEFEKFNIKHFQTKK